MTAVKALSRQAGRQAGRQPSRPIERKKRRARTSQRTRQTAPNLLDDSCEALSAFDCAGVICANVAFASNGGDEGDEERRQQKKRQRFADAEGRRTPDSASRRRRHHCHRVDDVVVVVLTMTIDLGFFSFCFYITPPAPTLCFISHLRQDSAKFFRHFSALFSPQTRTNTRYTGNFHKF